MNSSSDIVISHEIMKAAKWNAVGMFIQYGSLLINIIVLGRFVEPSIHGKAAIILSVSAFIMLFAHVGFSNAIIASRENDKRFADTLFTVSLLFSSFLYAVFFMLAPVAGNFYRDPSFILPLRLSGLGILFVLFNSIPLALLQQNLRYKAQVLLTTAIVLATLVSTVWLAVSGFGIWSLVLPSLIGNGIGTLVVFPLSRYLPRLMIDVSCLRKAFNFGISGLISNVSNYICGNIVPVVMGKIWSPVTLGFYSFAEKQYAKPFDVIASQLAGSLFPIFSKISDDIARMRNAYLRIIRFGLFLILPVYSSLIIGAPILFPFLFGEQWTFAILPFQIFCIVSMVRAFGIGANGVLYALGKPHISARIVAFRLAAYGAAVIVFVLFHASLLTVVSSMVVIDSIIIVVYLVASLMKVSCTIGDFVESVKSPIFMNVFFFALVFGFMHLLSSIIPFSLTRFFAGVGIASSFYIVLFRHFFHKEWLFILQRFHEKHS